MWASDESPAHRRSQKGSPRTLNPFAYVWAIRCLASIQVDSVDVHGRLWMAPRAGLEEST